MMKPKTQTKLQTREIIIATRNKKKLEEIREIMKGLSLKFLTLQDFPNAPYVKENGTTFLENASKKALKIARFAKKLTLGEDSGLCIDALGGKPGVWSSRFAGRSKSDLKNNLKVLKLLEGVPLNKRTAHYTCAVSLADENGLIASVEGVCRGLIGFEMKGTYGFGYDPLFITLKYNKTFAELGARIKHKISHRYEALKKTKLIVQRYYG